MQSATACKTLENMARAAHNEGMKITIKNDLYKIGLVLQGFSEKVTKQATARSANRAAITVRAQAARLIKEKYNLPIGGSSKGGGGLTPPGIKSALLIGKARYAKSKSIGEIYATISVSNKSISLIHFVRGDKQPAKQKGLAIKKRKRVKIAIRRGKTITLKNDFILRAHNSIQLYRRRNSGVVKQAIPSFFILVMKPDLKSKIEVYGQAKFAQEMETNLKYYASQIKVK